MIDVTQPPYSADKTGTNDATAAIKQTIAANRGKTLFFPAGRTPSIEQVRASGGGPQAFRVGPGCVATRLVKCNADGSGTFARILDQGTSTQISDCWRIGGALTPLPVEAT